MNTIDLSDVPRVPRLDEYFGLWAVQHSLFMAMFGRVSRMDVRMHVEQTQKPVAVTHLMKTPAKSVPRGGGGAGGGAGGAEENQPYLAVIGVTGTLMKQVGSMEDGSSTIRLRRDLRQAAADPNAIGILLLVDSPGGTVSGTSDLAAEVARAVAQKPVYAFVEDLSASAAYWVTSAATKIFANSATALVGSIGTYAGLYDLSGMAEKEGIKAKLYKTGPLKGAGFPGTEITAEQDAAFQKMVDETQTHFSAAVQANRRLSAAQMEAVTTGGVWLAAEAQALGLIDGIKTFDETLAALEAEAMKNKKPGAAAGGARSDVGSAQSQEEVPMEPGTTVAPPTPGANQGSKAATLAELKSAMPKSTADFREMCLEKGLTLAQATAAYAQALEQQLEARGEELTQARAAGKTIGVKPVNGGGAGGGGKGAAAEAGDFEQLVRDHMTARPTMERRDAIKAVAKAHPEAHKAYVAGMPKARAGAPAKRE